MTGESSFYRRMYCALSLEYAGSSQKMVLGPLTVALPRKLLKRQILRPYFKPTKSEMWGWGPEICGLKGSSR